MAVFHLQAIWYLLFAGESLPRQWLAFAFLHQVGKFSLDQELFLLDLDLLGWDVLLPSAAALPGPGGPISNSDPKQMPMISRASAGTPGP